MKKRNLTSLSLQKSTISNLNKKDKAMVGGASDSTHPYPHSERADVFLCWCSLGLCTVFDDICIPIQTIDPTCATTCTPESCYAC